MKEEKTKIHYLLMNKCEHIGIIRFDEQKQTELGLGKTELSIFCCIDQIYSFVLNYIIDHH